MDQDKMTNITSIVEIMILLVQLSEAVYTNIKAVAKMVTDAQNEKRDLTSDELTDLSNQVQTNLDSLKKLIGE